MFNGQQDSIRAYRPSHCATHSETDELDHEIEKTRRANVLRYAARVSAGLSIFGGDILSPDEAELDGILM
jgi:hypothetical protein